MHIIITGNRAEGKTTVAVLIARLFKEHGFDVHYMGFHPEDINELINAKEYKPDLSQQRPIFINDFDCNEYVQ